MRHLATAIVTAGLLLIANPALSEVSRGLQRALDLDHHGQGKAHREQRHVKRSHDKYHDKKHQNRKQEKKRRKQERKKEKRKQRRKEKRQHRREVRHAYKSGYNKGYRQGHRKGHRHAFRAAYRPYYRHGYRGHRPHWRPVHYGYGYRWRHLPHSFVGLSLGAASFFYSDGIFYRPASRGYVVTHAPQGAIVHSLPASALTVVVGGRHYYVAYDTYYLWDDVRRGYRVVPNPGLF
ncbi:DUF6515 family protein [Microbulbifer spongiae]|uniref:DUF6515 family protein n=1 Tax=Microbulbifer spongiae TaxID=2944933 RepID=A0ABY9EAX6_9GAMM|nr:DUF6515 family protein [Microbulbifer sp. MI-G]WKD49511.1 DUF6515 family protein [Microbulbifer sp. MI-G]